MLAERSYLGLIKYVEWNCTEPWKFIPRPVWDTETGGWAKLVFPPIVGALYTILLSKLRDEQILRSQVCEFYFFTSSLLHATPTTCFLLLASCIVHRRCMTVDIVLYMIIYCDCHTISAECADMNIFIYSGVRRKKFRGGSRFWPAS